MTDVSVTLRPPCLCPSEGQKHGVSIQSSINLGGRLLPGCLYSNHLSYPRFLTLCIDWLRIFGFHHMTGENRELDVLK